MDVGIRELKAHLSEYVERAANGQVVRVTDRGVPRAVLMAIPESDHIEQGIVEGWVVREQVEQPGDVETVEPRPGPSTTSILTDDRDS